jgi:undecaprenyl diphosphate synthase
MTGKPIMNQLLNQPRPMVYDRPEVIAPTPNALPDDLIPAALPQHIAMIMDGNGRWAKRRGLPRIAGHRQGVKTLKTLVRCCKDWGIPTLTAYAFSTENWRRPAAEVNFLMGLFEQVITEELVQLRREGVRLSFIGDLAGLPDRLRQTITQVAQQPVDGQGPVGDHRPVLNLVIALNYGGRAELVQACQQIAALVQQGAMPASAITETTIADHLTTAGMPDPDLLIRTSQELRLSNFLPWQLAYTELYFTDTYWPDFGVEDLHQALLAYQQRDRRFGQVAHIGIN